MSKTELIQQVAEKSDLTKKQAAAAVENVFAVIADAMAAGERVSLVGFGTFETKKREARTGRNPRTGEVVEIAASTAPVFKAGKALKDKVNG